MEIYQIILLIAVIILVMSIFLNILFSPITWIVVAILFIYSYIKRYIYKKQLEEYNKKVAKEMSEKKEAYQSGQAYRQGSEDIIDVNYVERDED